MNRVEGVWKSVEGVEVDGVEEGVGGLVGGGGRRLRHVMSRHVM